MSRWISCAVLVVATPSIAGPIQPPDLAKLRSRVFTADRDRAIGLLVRLGNLDAKLSARVPATAIAAKELAKLVAGDPRAAKLFVIEKCSLGRVTASEVVIRCEPRGCDDGCMVIRGSATVRVKNGRWSIEGLAITNVGDTGECGCCM
jgi:hypothetical protein